MNKNACLERMENRMVPLALTAQAHENVLKKPLLFEQKYTRGLIFAAESAFFGKPLMILDIFGKCVCVCSCWLTVLTNHTHVTCVWLKAHDNRQI